MAHNLQMTFSNVIYRINILNIDSNFTENCSRGSNLQYISIGSGNGLALKEHQAIIWTNDGYNLGPP